MAASQPNPTTGRTVVVEAASGKVLVKERGKRKFARLNGALAIPVGSTVDATDGKVKLISTGNKSGSKLQSGVFSKGAFVVTQKRASTPMTDLELIGGSFAGCASELRASGAVDPARSKARRRLFGNAHGHFRTRGRNGTATVRGTKWETEDSCVGTAAATMRGEVKAASDAGSEYDVKTGQRASFHCEPTGLAPVSSLYCLALLEQPADALFAFGIATSGTPDTSYEVCITGPNGAARPCDPLPFDTTDPALFAGGFACFVKQTGAYSVRWRIRGVDLPVPLPFNAPKASNTDLCVSAPPRPGIDDQFKGSALVRAAAGRH
jgi:hypothetical protein